MSTDRRRAFAATAVVSMTAALVQIPLLAQPAAAAPKAGCPATKTSAVAARIAASVCGGRVEATDLRTTTTQVWANPDGTMTAQVYAGPVRMRDAKGAWVPVDLTLHANPDGSVSP